ncbi:hypothetical protein B4102_0224 [Heyndrickxia sporothermodurans]|uniref:SH3b domain-containing protein n=1 Tax=Heyndrickxia sporothermodurans TaxID=46224 RepID=A0A150KS36_9BACI|nr:phage tail protein [Heyndrickxia sporothermodurans]KYD02630.1 hypothetical protein B4102_0224 [Heyndrickxia sporothermodurans]
MAKIGSFGDIVFETSTKKKLTFNEFERSGSARWNDHEIIGQKPKSEFSGPGLDEINITILLRAELGINPKKQLDKMRSMKDKGTAKSFVLGGKAISSNYWVIQQLVESYKTVDNRGNILTSEVTLSLKEYVINKKKAPKKKPKKKSTTTSKKKKKTLGVITIKVKSVHIRSGPGTKYKVLGYAFNKNKLTVYSKKNGWYSLGKGRYITANSAYSTFKKG